MDELYIQNVRLVCCADVAPSALFSRADNDVPIIDLEGLQFEGAVPGSRLRRDLTSDGGVAPVLDDKEEAKRTAARLGGAEEQFAFHRAISRLMEMQSRQYLASQTRSG